MTNDQRQVLAAQYIYEGRSVSQLADQYGIEPASMRQRLRTPSMQKVIDELREDVTDRVVQAQCYVRDRLITYVKEVDKICTNPDHPRQLDALKHSITWVEPGVQRHEHAVDVQHSLSGPVAEELTKTLRDLNANRAGAVVIDTDASILEGEAAVPKPIAAEAEVT